MILLLWNSDERHRKNDTAQLMMEVVVLVETGRLRDWETQREKERERKVYLSSSWYSGRMSRAEAAATRRCASPVMNEVHRLQ